MHERRLYLNGTISVMGSGFWVNDDFLRPGFVAPFTPKFSTFRARREIGIA